MKRKPTQTFNISLTLPMDVPAMSEIQDLVRSGYSFGLAIKKILTEWQPPKTTVVFDVADIVKIIAESIAKQPPLVIGTNGDGPSDIP